MTRKAILLNVDDRCEPDFCPDDFMDLYYTLDEMGDKYEQRFSTRTGFTHDYKLARNLMETHELVNEHLNFPDGLREQPRVQMDVNNSDCICDPIFLFKFENNGSTAKVKVTG